MKEQPGVLQDICTLHTEPDKVPNQATGTPEPNIKSPIMGPGTGSDKNIRKRKSQGNWILLQCKQPPQLSRAERERQKEGNKWSGLSKET